VDVDDEFAAIARVKRGDIGGLEPLVRRYHARAVRIWSFRSHALALDLTQTAFVRVFEGPAVIGVGAAAGGAGVPVNSFGVDDGLAKSLASSLRLDTDNVRKALMETFKNVSPERMPPQPPCAGAACNGRSASCTLIKREEPAG
jgi:ribosomal protein S5